MQSEKIGDSVSMLSTYHRLGQLYHANDKIDPAIAYFEKSVAISRELGDSGLPNSPTPYLAWAYVSGEQNEKALAIVLQYLENVQATERDVEHGMAHMVVGLILTKVHLEELSVAMGELFAQITSTTDLALTPAAYFQFAIDASRENNYLDTLIPALAYFGGYSFKLNPAEGLQLLSEAKHLAQSNDLRWSQKNIANNCTALGISYDDL